jgi:hypothetical protein
LKPAERSLLLDSLQRVIDENQHLARPGAVRRNGKGQQTSTRQIA